MVGEEPAVIWTAAELREFITNLARSQEVREALDELAELMLAADEGPTDEAGQDMLDAAVQEQIDYIAQMLGGDTI